MIAVGGENLIDYLKQPEGDHAAPGGSPFNVAMGLGMQSKPVTYLTPISDDKWGDMLHEKLVQSNVLIGAERRSEPTTMAIVTVTDGSPEYEFHRTGTAERAVTAEILKAAMPNDTSIMHVGSLALADDPDASVWVEAMQGAKQRGILTTLDPNVRLSIIADIDAFRARIETLLQSADIVKTSDEDLEGLYPNLGFDDAMARFVETATARLVIVTRGMNPGYAFLDGAMQRFEVVPADPLMDTVGAGDTFMATLIGAFQQKDHSPHAILGALTAETLTPILRRAAIAAAINCQRKGCQPPTMAEIDAELGASA